MARLTHRRRRRTGRSPQARRRDIYGAIIFAVTVVGFVGLGFVYYRVSESHIDVGENFCPLERPPSKIVAVLVDRSDPISPVQQGAIRKELEKLRATVPRYGAVEIYSVGPTTEGLREPVFKACNPGAPEEVDEWTEPRLQARKRWEESFRDPLDREFEKMLPEGSAEHSPIMESIQSVAVSAFSGRGLSDTPKTLVIVSDMLQNTEALSHYRSGLDYERFRQSLAYRQLVADLDGVRATILYVVRSGADKLQGKAHIEFWQRYFADHGGTLARVKSISG